MRLRWCGRRCDVSRHDDYEADVAADIDIFDIDEGTDVSRGSRFSYDWWTFPPRMTTWDEREMMMSWWKHYYRHFDYELHYAADDVMQLLHYDDYADDAWHYVREMIDVLLRWLMVISMIRVFRFLLWWGRAAMMMMTPVGRWGFSDVMMSRLFRRSITDESAFAIDWLMKMKYVSTCLYDWWWCRWCASNDVYADWWYAASMRPIIAWLIDDDDVNS